MQFSCDYCHETDNYVPILYKPNLFFWQGMANANIQIFRDKDFICLECLTLEIDHIKDTY